MRAIISLVFLALLSGCLSKAKQLPATADPSGSDTAVNQDPQFAAHQPRTECVTCHESDRLSEDHFAGQDCYSCHAYPSWSPTDAGGGDGAPSFSHDPTPESCVTCHEKDRESDTHFTGQDCANCHAFPDWSETTF